MLRKERIKILGLLVFIPLMTLIWITFLFSSIRTEYIAVSPLFPSGSAKLTERITQLQQHLDVSDQSENLTICSKKQGEIILSPFAESEATVYGIQDNYYDFRFFSIQTGRRIDFTDVYQAKRVAILDEAAALTLFHGQEAVGQTIIISGSSFEIVGICSPVNTLGEKDQHIILVPISAIETTGLKMETIECLLRSEDAALSNVMIQSALSEWDSEAQLFFIQQEVARTFLPMILAGIICMGILIIILFQMLIKKVRSANDRTHDILLHHYFQESIGSLIIGYIPVIVMCSAVVFGFYGLIRLCLFILTVFSASLPEQLLSITGWCNQLASIWMERSQCIRVSCREVETIRLAGTVSNGVYVILSTLLLGMFSLRKK